MNVDWIIPCRFVEVHDNLGTLVGAGIDTFWLPELPAAVQVVMAIRLLGLPEELATDVQHRGRNLVRGPDGETVSDISGEFTIAGGEHARPDWLQGIILPLVIQFQATEAGTYTFEHMVDDSSASVPLHVVQGLPPGVVVPPHEE